MSALQEANMQYMLLIHQDESGMEKARKEDIGAMMAAYGAYTQAMRDAGVLRSGERLHPAASATIVRHRDGKSQVLNGPYAEAKEQLGGFYIIEAADLDAAITWAARCPGAQHGSMEVRPIWPM
jgi:hypothetical protein